MSYEETHAAAPTDECPMNCTANHRRCRWCGWLLHRGHEADDLKGVCLECRLAIEKSQQKG